MAMQIITFALLAVGFLLVCVWIVKIAAIWNATNWIKDHGIEYKLAVDDKLFDNRHKIASGNYPDSLSDTELYEIYNNTGGRFRPFGVKDFKLREKYGNKYVFLLTYPFLVTITSVFVLIFSTIDRYASSATAGHTLAESVIISLCCLMFVVNFEMILQFCFGVIVVGEYVKYIHLIDDRKFFSPLRSRISNRNLSILRGVTMLMALFCGVVLSGICSVYSGILLFDSFNIGNTDILNYLHNYVCYNQHYDWISVTYWIARMTLMVTYYVTTTVSTVGYGDILPNDDWGYIVAIILHLETISLLSFGFAIFWSTPSQTQSS